MAKLNILFVIFCVSTICLARRVPRNTATKNDFVIDGPTSNPNFGEECVNEASEGLKMLTQYCPRLVPQQIFSESMNAVVLSEEYADFSEVWSRKMETASGPTQVNLVVEMCNFVNHPNYIKDATPNQMISHEQMCELAIITDKAEKEKDTITDVEKLAVNRQVCRMYASVEIIATASRPATDTVLTPEQFNDLKSMWEQVNCTYTLDCDDADYITKACKFLNETVSHEDQAKKLGITVELYEKLVAVRKLYSDKTDEGRLALAKRSCEAIDGIDSDGVNLTYGKNVLTLSTEKMQEFNDMWLGYYNAADSDKMSTLRNVCHLLKDEKLY